MPHDGMSIKTAVFLSSVLAVIFLLSMCENKNAEDKLWTIIPKYPGLNVKSKIPGKESVIYMLSTDGLDNNAIHNYYHDAQYDNGLIVSKSSPGFLKLRNEQLEVVLITMNPDDVTITISQLPLNNKFKD